MITLFLWCQISITRSYFIHNACQVDQKLLLLTVSFIKYTFKYLTLVQPYGHFCPFIYIYMCMCRCIYVYVYMCVCMYVCVYIYVCMYVCIYICMYVCIYVYICVYICICVYIYVYNFACVNANCIHFGSGVYFYWNINIPPSFPLINVFYTR